MTLLLVCMLALPSAPKEDPASLIRQMEQLYRALEYDRVIPLADRLLAHPAVTVDMRLAAHLMKGTALAIVGDPVEAEKPFRFILRGRPEFELPVETSPKVMAVFRKVQVEERAIVEQMRALERQRIIATLELSGDVPREGAGGTPIPFLYGVRDPTLALGGVRLHFRVRGEPAFSSFALRREESGRWAGEIPGELTENEQGLVVHYYVTALDAAGEELRAWGGPAAPSAIDVTPGTAADAVPLYRSKGFWAATLGGVVAVVAAGVIIYVQSTELPDSALGVYDMP